MFARSIRGKGFERDGLSFEFISCTAAVAIVAMENCHDTVFFLQSRDFDVFTIQRSFDSRIEERCLTNASMTMKPTPSLEPKRVAPALLLN